MAKGKEEERKVETRAKDEGGAVGEGNVNVYVNGCGVVGDVVLIT